MKLLWLSLLPLALAFRTLEPPAPPPVTRATLLQGYVDVRLNHFDASNTDVFPMRYYYNGEFATGKDLVIFVGGEWAISEGWVRGGLAYELAEHLGAGLVYSEHRYYGLTRPTNTTSPSELRFLTVDQALADLVQFINILKSDGFQNGQFKDGKVVLVGCSYAGSMATWMRVAYPHVVDAAFSDSGPLHAQEDFPEYLETITEALRVQGGEECVSSIEQAVRQLETLLDSSGGAATISTLFNTCAPLNTASGLDRATFAWFGITETFASLVQYATPGNIPAACAALTDTSISSSALERLAAWIRVQPYSQPCIESRYEQQVALHTNTNYDAREATMRLWTYQTCVEFGWYQTTSSGQQPFSSLVPLEYFHQMCKDFFTSFFDESLLRAGISRSNLLFGGRTLPDRVVSVAGGLDPWSPMGPNAGHAHSMAPVYVVPEVSHCRAVQSTANSDNEQLAAAKVAVLNHLHQWVRGEPLLPEAGALTDSASSLNAALTVVAATLIASLV